LPTALRVAAFSLRSQGYFGEEGSAKQGEKSWFNLPDGKAGSPRLCLGNVGPGFTLGFNTFLLQLTKKYRYQEA
jgi:hypothetical protein